jgi:hypothetical protein
MKVSAQHQPTPRINQPLTKRDRCDACKAQAKVRVTLKTGDLLFCQHHYDKHAKALEDRQENPDGK